MSETLLFFSDVHVHHFRAHSRVLADGTNSRLANAVGVLDFLTRYCRQEGIRYALCGGGVFHERGRLDVKVFNQARAAFRTLAQAVDRLILIVGNHDQSPTNEREHALEAFKDFAMVVDTPQEIALGRATLAAFPFLRDAQEHRRLFKAYNRPSVDVVSTHVGVAGVPGRTFLIAEPVQRRHLATRAGGYEAQGRRAPPDQHGEGRPRRGVPGRAAADAVGGHGPLAHRLPWRCA